MKFKAMFVAATALMVGSGIGVTPLTAHASAQGLGNPATAYCKRIGGRPIVRNTPQGEAGFCRLRNGRVVDEWKLFRDANQKKGWDRGRSRQIGAASPASVYCHEQGGLTKMRMTEEGEMGYCHLPGGRVVEEWEFFREGNR